MPQIIAYTKASDAYTVYSLNAPEGATELCTLDGVTYTVIPDGAEPGEQPEQIAASVQVVTLDIELRERIKASSPHAQLISARIIERIRERYTLDHELYLARISGGIATGLHAPSADEMEEMAAYSTYVEGVRAWGRQQRAALGLA